MKTIRNRIDNFEEWNKSKKLVLDFLGHENVNEFYSQAAQDIFVLSCLNGKRNGTFLDLGCAWPQAINNTFLLEKEFGWNGLSFEIDKSLIDLWDNRKTVSLCQDCRYLDFEWIIKTLGTSHIDYLSLDLHPSDVTLQCLKSIPFGKINFSIITFEHDCYRDGDYCKLQSRKIFENNNYKMICDDVNYKNRSFEDWYYNPKFVSYDKIKNLKSNYKEWEDIVFEPLN